nr:collagen alpha-3(VI) chain-like isoform X2 [Nerophis lumbriciformis]
MYICFLSILQGHDTKRDIVFLLDGSDNTRDGFSEIKLFLKSIVESLFISENQDRVSVVQFSDKPDVNFYLNSHKTQSQVTNAIGNLRHSGGRRHNIGAALQFVRHSVFTSSSGSRRLEGVPQMLILLTTKPSTDDVRGPAFALKEHDIVSIGVGLGDADFSGLETISFKPGFIYKVTNVSILPTIQSKLLDMLNVNKVTEESTTGQPDLIMEDESLQRDIVFLVDGSDESLIGFPAIKRFITQVVQTLTVGENRDRVAVVQYSSDSRTHFSFNTYTESQDVLTTVQQLQHKGGGYLNTGAALEYVRTNTFTDSSGSRRREGVPQIVILLSGGISQDDVASAAAALKDDNIFTFCIGTKTSDILELQTIAHIPSYAFSVRDFEDIGKIHQQLVSFVKRVPRQPSSQPVLDSISRDIVFLLDGSNKSKPRFEDIKDFVLGIVAELHINTSKDHVAVVQYSNTAQIYFNLAHFFAKDILVDTIRGLSHKGGSPNNIGAALQYVRDYVFTPESGSRLHQGVSQVLFVLSNERSADDIRAPVRMLKELGVIIIAIGTANADTLQLQTMSHNARYALSVTDYKELPTAKEGVLSLLKEAPQLLEQSAAVESFDSQKNDVVFLIDGSYDSRNGFEMIRQFIEKMAENFNLDDDRDQVAVVQYSRDSTVNFYLNSYSSKTDVLNSIRTMRHKYGRPLNLGKALEFVRDNVFAASVGGRREYLVPQYLFVFSGGRSQDDVRGPAQSLKKNGIKTFSIGTENADTLDMQNISFKPSHYFYVTSFTHLPSIHQPLRAILEDVEETTGYTPTVVDSQPVGKDIVFLLDGSDTTRNGFSAMTDFVQQVVEALNVDDNRDRVSVVQYSRDAAVQFYLNTYTTQGEILEIVKGLKHKGGKPLNTGAALQYLRDNVFTASVGSRRLEGVPQVLILLSGGMSFDSVDASADALKQLGVLIFAIGNRGSDSRELQKIAHDPRYALSVAEFSDLPSVQQQLQSSVDTVVIDVTPESPPVIGTFTKHYISMHG